MTFTVLRARSCQGVGGQERRVLHEAIGLRRLGARMIILGQPGSGCGAAGRGHGMETRACCHARQVLISLRFAPCSE